MRALIFILSALAGSNALAGYDLHITRKAFWADETGPAISAAEWTAYVAADAQVQRDPDNSENDFIVLIGAERFPSGLTWNAGKPTQRARQTRPSPS